MSNLETDVLPELPEMKIQKIVESFKNVYQQVTNIDNIRVLKGTSDSPIVVSEWKQRNLEKSSMLRIQRCTVVDNSFVSAVNINISDVSYCLLSAFSKSELLKATISFTPSEDSVRKSKFFLDIWNEGKLTQTYDLSRLNIHEAIYTDATFGALSWSSREDAVIYIAEKKSAKTAPFWPPEKSAEKQNDECGMGEQYIYEDDWGEQLSPKKHGVVVVCSLVNQSVELMEGMPDDISPAQVTWEPNGEGIVGVGFYHKPKRLGIVFCSNRPSCIFYLTLDRKYVELSDENMSVSSPRFSPNGRYLVWLQRARGGPHQSAFALVKCDWNTKNITTVIDIIPSVALTKNRKEFYGIYCYKLPLRCWTSDSNYVLFSTCQTHRINSYAVAVDDGALWDIGCQDEDESTIIFDVTETNFAVGEKTSFKLPSTLVAIDILSAIEKASKDSDPLSWNSLTFPPELNNLNIVNRFTVKNQLTNEKNCYASYYGPVSDNVKSVPVVMFIHGGPHSSSSSVFDPSLHLFTMQGFGVLIVNYRGSVGCGNDFVYALLGNIGNLDVGDCYSTLQIALEKFPWLDPENVMLFGGSHGGFIATHLSSRFPEAFRSVVTRNPNVNTPAKIFLTDIPDWNTVECGFPYNGISELMRNEPLWKKMTECCPMYYVNSVKVPTLILLGKKDLRIPYSASLAYYYALKELKVPTRVLIYDDNHSLRSVPVEMDSMINTLIWFKRCMV